MSTRTSSLHAFKCALNPAIREAELADEARAQAAAAEEARIRAEEEEIIAEEEEIIAEEKAMRRHQTYKTIGLHLTRIAAAGYVGYKLGRGNSKLKKWDDPKDD